MGCIGRNKPAALPQSGTHGAVCLSFIDFVAIESASRQEGAPRQEGALRRQEAPTGFDIHFSYRRGW